VNYAHGIPFFCVSIAYAQHGTIQLGVVYDPMRDEMFSAKRSEGAWLNGRPLKVTSVSDLQYSLLVTGFPYDAWTADKNNFALFERFGRMTQGVRRLGSAALDLCYVASGRLEGFWELAIKPWDIAAGGLIAEEAGAKVSMIDGRSDYVQPPCSILAATPGIYNRMLEELSK